MFDHDLRRYMCDHELCQKFRKLIFRIEATFLNLYILFFTCHQYHNLRRTQIPSAKTCLGEAPKEIRSNPRSRINIYILSPCEYELYIMEIIIILFATEKFITDMICPTGSNEWNKLEDRHEVLYDLLVLVKIYTFRLDMYWRVLLRIPSDLVVSPSEMVVKTIWGEDIFLSIASHSGVRRQTFSNA